MNAPVDSEYAFVAGVPVRVLEDAVPKDKHGALLGSLLREVALDGNLASSSVFGYEISSIAATYRSPWIDVGIERLFMTGEQPPKTDIWRASVSFLAALCFSQTGVWPEMANVFLYRDGNDFLPWHIDSEIVYGPAAGDMFAATYSFGCERVIEFAPIGRPRESVRFHPPTGSLYVMDPDTQRRFMHRVMPQKDGDGGPVGPRIGVTFFVRQTADPKDLPYTLVVNAVPAVVGTFEEVGRHYDSLGAEDLNPLATGFILPTGKMTTYPGEVTACAKRLGHLPKRKRSEKKGKTRTRKKRP